MSLAKFTPSVMSWNTLEKIFVAREKLLERIMGRVEEASKSKKRNHTLIVGPRGSGKTHLVALAYHRTKALIDSGSKLLVSWLPEDPYSIKSYRRLLAAILDRIEGQNNEDKNEAASSNITYHFINEQEHENALESQLSSLTSEQGPVIVIIENLDQILLSIGRIGQERFRNFLQSSSALLVLATTTRLDRRLASVDSPFFEFFNTTRLEPFTVDEAREFLVRVAELDGDDQLVAELGSAETNTKLHVIAHLAGGQPRLWSVLGSALTVKEIDELVDMLLTRFDDLTAYYQERMSSLSDNQQLVVDELARSGNALHVAEIARRTEISQRSVAKTISDLVEYGWLEKVSISWAPNIDKRQSFYELAEPMARLAFQIKDSRGEPLPLIIDFLKNWFTDDELTSFDSLGPTAEQYVQTAVTKLFDDDITYVSHFLSGFSLDDLAHAKLPASELLGKIDDAIADICKSDSRAFFGLPTPIRAVLDYQITIAEDQSQELNNVRIRIHDEALSGVVYLVDNDKRNIWLRRAVNLVSNSEDCAGLYTLARWQIVNSMLDEAKATIKSLERLNASPIMLAMAYRNYINELLQLGRDKEASYELVSVTKLIEQLPNNESTLTARLYLLVGKVHWVNGSQVEADEFYKKGLSSIVNVLTSDDYLSSPLYNSMILKAMLDRDVNGIFPSLFLLVDIDHLEWSTFAHIAESFYILDDYHEALEMYQKVLGIANPIYSNDDPLIIFVNDRIQELNQKLTNKR